MARQVATGEQAFARLRENDLFYIDKTRFIQDWWNKNDAVTLITRPQRFGKTLTLDTVRTFFSPEFAGRSDLFDGLSIWNDKKFRAMQGKVPVIFLSLAAIKERNYENAVFTFCDFIITCYNHNAFLLDSKVLNEEEKQQFKSVRRGMPEPVAKTALFFLAQYLERFYQAKPIILLDEYDTPMQEAWMEGYWDELVKFLRGFFNATFKSNPHLGRGLITGITRISKESLFSDLNNLCVVTSTSDFYSDCFGFTEEEVFAAMDEFGLPNKEKVKYWYDGFIFGKSHDIYNPWSITQYLDEKRFRPYWAETSPNAMVSELIRRGDAGIKVQAERLLNGGSITVRFDEQTVFSQLAHDNGAIWSLLLAAGYVKILSFNEEESEYEIALTNHEVKVMLERLIECWFNRPGLSRVTEEFHRALIEGDMISLNDMMQRIALETFSWFDATEQEPERFYHGFVLGLLVDLKKRFALESNRESGFGRYDVMLIPLDKEKDPGIIIEFKSLDARRGERDLSETALAALRQIKERKYAAALTARGIPENRILAYGFAFRGKEVLVEAGK